MGGASLGGAHRKCRYIDVEQRDWMARGPSHPSVRGQPAAGPVIDLCFPPANTTKAELKLLNKGRGGLIDLLGTSDLREVERPVEGRGRRGQARL